MPKIKILVRSNTFNQPNYSAYMLLFVNIVLIFQAIVFKWDIGTMVWTYWMQGLAIVLVGLVVSKFNKGWFVLLMVLVFYVLFLVSLTFPFEGATYTINGQIVPADEFTIFRYVNWNYVFINSLFVAFYHVISAWMDGTSAGDLRTSGKVVKRILPLHLIIIFATFIPLPVVIFMILKTFADLSAHGAQHAFSKNKKFFTKT